MLVHHSFSFYLPMSEVEQPSILPVEDASLPREGAPLNDDTSPRGAGAEDQQPPSPQRTDRRSRMELLLRQWASSSSIDGNDDHTLGGVEGSNVSRACISTSDDCSDILNLLRIDRSASLDDDQIANFTSASTDSILERSDSHRRVSSAGGDRLPLELSQLFEVGGGGEPLLDSAALHDAARITDWPTVLSLSRFHPESAKFVGKEGWNALHHACDRRCPHVDVMDALLTAYPEALVQTNDKGWTPLHRACRNKTPRDVVKLLLRKYPDLGKRAATMRCNDGRSSLHYALLYDAPEGVVELLLQADPGAVLDEDRDGVTPLGTVWDKYANSFEGKRVLRILAPFEGEGWGESSGRNNNYSEEVEIAQRTAKEAAEQRIKDYMRNDQPAFSPLQRSWKTANTLLRAYFRFPLQEEKLDEDSTCKSMAEPATSRRKWRVFHATCAIKCHPKLLLLARAIHPEEAREVDENDLFRGAGQDVSPLSDLQSNQLSNRTALHFAAMSPLSGRDGRNAIKLLLKLNPDAARHVDGNGSLPLHLICQNVQKLQWVGCGPKDVYEAYPEASAIGDGYGRTPLHCIASALCQYKRTPPARLSTHVAQNAEPSVPIVRIAAGVAGLNVVDLDESVIQNLVDANAIAASMPDDSGRLPLHYVAERAEEWTSDITSILTAYPAAAQIRAGPSTYNQLPLHMAAASPDARPSLIMNLVIANPRAASIMDGMGRLPLHLAVDSGRTVWDLGINAIYEAYTPAISLPEESPRRWTALHTAAASHSAGREVIGKIIALNGNSASIPDGDLKYPLHLACATNKSWGAGGVQAIFDADPSVGLSEDSNHMLPFHIAAFAGCRANKTLSEDAARDDIFNDEIESLEVLFNLLTAQPSIVQL